jgi:hypothetical protein
MVMLMFSDCWRVESGGLFEGLHHSAVHQTPAHVIRTSGKKEVKFPPPDFTRAATAAARLFFVPANLNQVTARQNLECSDLPELSFTSQCNCH